MSASVSYSSVESAILRTLACHETWKYLPTRVELFLTLDVGPSEGVINHAPTEISREEVLHACTQLLESGVLRELDGRIGRAASFDSLLQVIRERDPLQARKRRRARLVTRWLAQLSGVRFVALANTTAVGNARDEGDLDFFVIVRAGTIWTTRLCGVAPFKFWGKLPRINRTRDAVCLSYYIADDHLDLSSHQLSGDDPYFRQWFLTLVPLFDDGVSSELWTTNQTLRARHPFAQRWIPPPDLRVAVPRLRIPSFAPIESAARLFQLRWFPDAIRLFMNVDTRVIVNDSVLKFHVDDGREAYRSNFYDLCKIHNIEP